jgi:hypothetical protein
MGPWVPEVNAGIRAQLTHAGAVGARPRRNIIVVISCKHIEDAALHEAGA